MYRQEVDDQLLGVGDGRVMRMMAGGLGFPWGVMKGAQVYCALAVFTCEYTKNH